MSEYTGPRAFRFKDGRTGLLSPFGIDRDGVYEITDSTLGLAEQYREGGLIEFLDEPVEPEPPAATTKTTPTPKRKAKPAPTSSEE